MTRIVGSPKETGKHTSSVGCINDRNEPVTDPFKSDFEIPKMGGAANLVLNVQMVFPRLGVYRFVVDVDGKRFGEWPFLVVGQE